MPRRRLLILALALGVLAAAPAAARLVATTEFDQFPDATNDGDPDISRVFASSNASGAITFVVEIANRRGLAENEYVQVHIDADTQPATGREPNGLDFVLQMDRADVGLFRWDGSAFTRAQSRTVYGYVYKGFRMAVHKRELGGVPSGAFSYWVETISGAKSDDAPDGRIAQHRLSTLPLQLTIAAFSAPRTVRVGKRWAVAMRVNRSDLQAATSAGLVRCVAKVGRRNVKAQAVFPEDVAGCVGTAPKSARRKTIRVTISLTLDGVTVSRTASIKVR